MQRFNYTGSVGNKLKKEMKNMNYILLLSIFIFGYGNKLQSQDQIPNHDSFNIESKQVGEMRVINVWTPQNMIIVTIHILFYICQMVE